MAIELVPLCTVKVQLKPPITIEGGPAGTRMIFEVAGAEAEGEGFTATLKGEATADWLVVGAEGTGTLDVRATLETDDGAVIFAQYNGKADLTAGMQFPATIYVAPRFETGDARYAWLNRVQAIGKGIVDENLVIRYEWYVVR